MFCCVEGEGQEVKDWLLGSALCGLLGVQAAAAYLLTWHWVGSVIPGGKHTQADTHTHSHARTRTHTSCSCTAAGRPGLCPRQMLVWDSILPAVPSLPWPVSSQEQCCVSCPCGSKSGSSLLRSLGPAQPLSEFLFKHWRIVC